MAEAASQIHYTTYPVFFFFNLLQVPILSEFNPIPSYECILCYALDRIELASNEQAFSW